MNNKKIDIFDLIMNIIIVIFEIIGFVVATRFSGGLAWAVYYTQLSNLLLLISSSLMIAYIIRKLSNGKQIPKGVNRFKFAATLSVTITFLVVIFILSGFSIQGLILNLTYNSMLYHHTIGPVLGILTFILFEKYDLNKGKDILIAMIFTIVYGFIAIILNALGVLRGPYFFLLVREQPIWQSILWFVFIYGMAYEIALFLRWLNIKLSLNK